MVTAVVGRWWVAVGIVAICAGAPACSRPPSTSGDTTESPGAPDHPPPLPNLADLDATLQEQIRIEHAALDAGSADPATRAGRYGRLGTLLLAAEHAQAAEAFFQSARMFAPSDLRWPYYLGHVYRATHRLDEAAEAFAGALRLDPRHVPSLVWLGDTHLANGNAQEALTRFEEAVSADQTSAAAWFGRGRAAVALRQFAAAVPHLERARSLAPEAVAVQYQLGLAYRALGDRERAAPLLAREAPGGVPPIDPLMDDLPALLQTGAAHLTRGLDAMERRDWSAAVGHLRAASASAPNDAVVHVNLGTALYLSGDVAGARRALETAIRAEPGMARAHYTLALMAEADGRDADAIAGFSTAARLDPAYAEAHASLADALRRGGRVEQSLVHYTAVLKIDPAASPARFGYGMALVRLGRYREARDWLRDAAALHADQPGFAHALARVLAAAPDAAVRDGREALRIADALWRVQQSPALAETMAMALAESGRYPEAVQWQRQAIEALQAAGQAGAVARMQPNLARYAARQPCRTPWAATDPVHFPRPAT